MSEIGVEKYAGKMNRVGYEAFLNSMRHARGGLNRYVEISHWLYHVVSNKDSDISVTLEALGLDRGVVLRELSAAIDRLDRNVTETPSISEYVSSMLNNAWVYATLYFGEAQIRTGHALVALLSDDALRRAVERFSGTLGQINPTALATEARTLWRDSEEEALRPMDRSGLAAGSAAGRSGEGPGAATALGRFSVDMTAEARSGRMDPIVGRDDEIRQIVDVLLRRRQNNPILTGEAGVGKTAVVEGFAQALVSGDVPPALHGTSLLMLDIQAMQAGASMKGEFEQRLKSVIDDVQSSDTPIILFIDEAHMLVGAGGAAGTGDAANLLKPALARGTLRTIAATTWSEYRQHFEKDPALTRRFQPVHVDEPDHATCAHMLRGILAPMERHHGVRISDEAITAAVTLSARYVPSRQLPDKAVSLLDTACARVAISQAALPARVQEVDARLASLASEIAALESDRELGETNEERLVEARHMQKAAQEERATLREAYEAERTLVMDILHLRAALRQDQPPAEPASAIAKPTADACNPGLRIGVEVEVALTADVNVPIVEEHAEHMAAVAGAVAQPPLVPLPKGASPHDLRMLLQEKMDALAGRHPDERMVSPHVDAQTVAKVISDWTGIPAGRMMQDELQSILTLGDQLKERVVGQDAGLAVIVKRIETSRAGLSDPDKPIGVFMLCGPSGVGKTETALALAELLYGGEQNLITINMSEFQEAHSVSLLKGAPPGYVGYGEGGRLTEAVRRKPYSVVLLDEVEKAHPDVHELFFQVFDKGKMEDGTGRAIDFRNTLILLTSNVGTHVIMDLCRDGQVLPPQDEIETALKPHLLQVFPPALLGRIVTIPYAALSSEVLRNITQLKFAKVQRRMREAHKAELDFDETVIDHVVAQCRDPDSGARMIDNIITNSILPDLSREVLARMVSAAEISRIAVTLEEGELRYGFG